MTAAKQLVDMRFLRTLVPLGEWSEEQLQHLMGSYEVELIESGKQLFAAGDNDPYVYYLLSGQILLKFQSGSERTVRSQTTQSRYILIPERPRTATAVTQTTATVLKVNKTVMDATIGLHNNGMQVDELDANSGDWMSKYLKSKVFLRLRAQNIQAIMMRLEEVPVRAGQVIIRQNDDDGYYYIIKQGHCQVTRRNSPNGKEIEIAELTVGAGFGEEAIISHNRRGATVTMLDNGYLMRLSRNDFRRLLVEPLIEDVCYLETKIMKDFVFLDVRQYDDYVKNGLVGAQNINFAELRPNLDSLDSNITYVAYSNHSYRAAAAAFLLCQHGLDGTILRGGLEGVPRDIPRGNQPDIPLDDIPVIDNVIHISANVDIVSDNLGSEPLSNSVKPSALAPAKNTKKDLEKSESCEEDSTRLEADREIARLKKVAQRAKWRATKVKKELQSELKTSVEQAKKEGQQATRQKEFEIGAIYAEMEESVRQADAEAKRAQEAELARRYAEEEASILKQKIRHSAQQTAQAEKAALQSTKYAQKIAEENARRQKQAEKQLNDEMTKAADLDSARQRAEHEVAQLKVEAESYRKKMHDQTRAAADNARQIAEEEASRLLGESSQRESELRQLQENELTELRQKLEKSQHEAQQQLEESQAKLIEREEKIRLAEHAKASAERHAKEVELQAAISRIQRQDEVNNAADLAREQAAHEANRKAKLILEEKQAEIDRAIQLAEENRKIALKATEEQENVELEISKLRSQAEETQHEMQTQLSGDIARSEIEHEVARARAIELANKQLEIEEISQRADEDAERAQKAERARLEAEQEIAKLREEIERANLPQKSTGHSVNSDESLGRQQTEEITKKKAEIEEATALAAQEAERAEQAESAFVVAQEEIARLNAEVGIAAMQAKAQLKADEDRAADQAIEVQQKAVELEQTQAKILAAMERAKLESQRTEEAVVARKEAEGLLEQYKDSADDQQKVQQELDKVRAESVAWQASIDKAKSHAKEEAERTQETQKALLIAEAEIQELKEIAAEQHLRAEQAIRASMQAADKMDSRSTTDNSDEQDDSKDELQSQWVSDHVMWEATLGIREDDAVSHIIAPDAKDELPEELKETLYTEIPLQASPGPSDDPHKNVFERRTSNRSTDFSDLSKSRNSAREVESGTSSYSQARPHYKKSLVKSAIVTTFVIVSVSMVGMYYSMSQKQQVSVKTQVKQWADGSVGDQADVTTPSKNPQVTQRQQKPESIEERVLRKQRIAEQKLYQPSIGQATISQQAISQPKKSTVLVVTPSAEVVNSAEVNQDRLPLDIIDDRGKLAVEDFVLLSEDAPAVGSDEPQAAVSLFHETKGLIDSDGTISQPTAEDPLTIPQQ